MRSSTTAGGAGCGRRNGPRLAGVTPPIPVSSPCQERLPAIDCWVAGELVSLVVADAALAEAHADDWISVQLLATASVLLRRAGTPFVLPRVDVPASLVDAALALRLCD